MKKLLFLLLLISGYCNAQYPSGYTGINSRYDWLAGKFRALHAPSGASAALTTGQWSGAGALFVDTSGGGIGLYYYNGLNWIRLRDTTEAGGGSGTVTSVATGYGLSGGTITTTGTLIADTAVGAGLFPWQRWLKVRDSLAAGLSGISGSPGGSNTYADLTTSIVDGPDYNGFPWPIQKGDTTIVFVPQFNEHIGPGPIRVFKSQTGGRNWALQGSVRVDGTTLSITALQVGLIGDTMHLSYCRSASYDTIFFAKNYGGGLDFTSTGYVKYQTGWVGSPAINNIFKMVSDTVYAPMYELDADSSRAFLCYYTGGTWYRGNTVLLQTGTTFPNGLTNEWGLIITKLGTMDANTEIATLHRNGNYGYYTHVRTSNGFITSTEDVTNLFYEFGVQETRSPLAFYMLDSTVYIIDGNRRTTGMMAIEYCTISASNFFTNNQAGYSKVRKLYSGAAGFKAAGEDFGYPMTYEYNGKPYIAFYDVSPIYTTPGEGGEDDVRSISFPLLDRGYSEIYNDANQSITDSIQTLVSFPDLLLDCMGSYDFDGETNTVDSVWEAKEDGWYTINAIATFEANSTGSYRQMYVVVADPGYNTTATNQLISKTTIPGHVSNSDFNRVECNGMAYIKQGEQVKVFVKHDATTALNLLNTSRETRASLKITIVR